MLFLVAGVLLIASEAVHMAIVPVFLGAAALVVAALRAVGILESVPLSFLIWSITSVALALPLRPLVKRFIGRGESKYDRSDEDKDALGEVVEVVEDVDDATASGRIRYRGTTWVARSLEGKIAKGMQAKLYAKDKLVWVVEPLNVLDDNNRVAAFDAGAAASVTVGVPIGVDATIEQESFAKGKK